ncbi:MAG: LVIVD repeat-containing protein, partial [Candidatus Zixiibacteriota bacterium]
DYVAIGDEIGTGPHTRIFDLQNLASITKVADIEPNPAQPVHNCYTRNDTLFIAHYALGLRMYDVSDPTNPVDVGHYDSYPGATVGYVGAWNVYPYFPSGKIIISDMQTGLYVLEVAGGPPVCCVGNRGDLNNDGTDINVLDLTFAVDRIFRGGPASVCPEESDVNGDLTPLNVLDLTFIVDRIFRGGPAAGPC